MSKNHRLLKMFLFLSQGKLCSTVKTGCESGHGLCPKELIHHYARWAVLALLCCVTWEGFQTAQTQSIKTEATATPTATWLKPAAITQAHTYWGTLVKTTRNGLGSLAWRP